MKRPKQPKATPQEIAIQRRTELRLDEEIGKTESRLKAQARGTVGAQSLLKGFQGRDKVPVAPASQDYGSGLVGKIAKGISAKRKNEMRGVKRL